MGGELTLTVLIYRKGSIHSRATRNQRSMKSLRLPTIVARKFFRRMDKFRSIQQQKFIRRKSFYGGNKSSLWTNSCQWGTPGFMFLPFFIPLAIHVCIHVCKCIFLSPFFLCNIYLSRLAYYDVFCKGRNYGRDDKQFEAARTRLYGCTVICEM